MFGFGLFSTHLPYLLLTAIYLIYFGVFALNRLNQSEQENQETATSTQFFNAITIAEDDYDYTAQHDDPSGISQDNLVLNHFIQRICIKGSSPPGYLSIPSGQIHSRPPPCSQIRMAAISC